MTDHLFDGSFVTAVNTNGEKQSIPAKWLDTRPGEFRLPPSHPDRNTTVPTRSEVPDATWTVNALRGYATRHGIDLGDATRKADILAVLTTQTPDPTPGPDETPAAGDEKEN